MYSLAIMRPKSTMYFYVQDVKVQCTDCQSTLAIKRRKKSLICLWMVRNEYFLYVTNTVYTLRVFLYVLYVRNHTSGVGNKIDYTIVLIWILT